MPDSYACSRPHPDCPLVAAYGLGVDSTAMLVEFAQRGISSAALAYQVIQPAKLPMWFVGFNRRSVPGRLLCCPPPLPKGRLVCGPTPFVD